MKHVRRTHAIVLPLPPEEAFPLFTPAGEKLWIREWDPRYLHPASGETQAGMVFTTGAGDELTFWSLVDYDPVAHRARYARVTPASRLGLVEVACHPEAGGTRVTVSYTFTALTPAGESFLEGFGEDAFRAMIDGWKGLIEVWLRNRG
ncbi:MAG: SRPBCC family protein [Betaproteobacteria bacterium]